MTLKNKILILKELFRKKPLLNLVNILLYSEAWDE